MSKLNTKGGLVRSNKIRSTLGEKLFTIANTLFLCLLVVITIYPFLYIVFGSLSDPIRLSGVRGPLLHPMGFSLRGYEAVFKMKRFWGAYLNTIFYLVAGTGISMVLTILGAFVLSIKGFMLRKPFTILVILTMYFSGGMIPTYLAVKQLGLTETVWAILIPGCISVYYMVVLRTSFQGIPVSLYESAEIDGANYITILLRITLPLSKAALATITLFYAVGRWGDWYNAMIYLQNRNDLFPLQMFLRQLLLAEDSIDVVGGGFSSSGADFYLLKQVIRYAATVLSTIPVLIVYPFLQKYFTKGVMVGSVKG